MRTRRWAVVAAVALALAAVALAVVVPAVVVLAVVVQAVPDVWVQVVVVQGRGQEVAVEVVAAVVARGSRSAMEQSPLTPLLASPGQRPRLDQW